MSHVTLGERLTIAWARQHGFDIKSIPTENEKGAQRPDFLVVCPDGKFVIEVKDLAPNDEENEYELRARRGEPGGQWINPGERLRGRLKDATKKTKFLRDDPIPFVAIIVNTTWTPGTSQLDFQLAMYGRFAKWRGQECKQQSPLLHSKQNTKISAAAGLTANGSDLHTMTIYHNRHAEAPLLYRSLWRSPYIKHFCIKLSVDPDQEYWTHFEHPEADS